MAMTNSLLKFFGTQFTEADKTWTYLKTQAAANTLTWDKFFQSTSKFWIDSMSRAWDLAPFTEGTPVAYDTVGNAAGLYAGNPIAVEPIPADKVAALAGTFLPIKAAKAATGTPAPALQSDGTLKIDVNALANLTKDDCLLITVHYPLTGGATKTVALLVLSVI
jgi:hypothetical protein